MVYNLFSGVEKIRPTSNSEDIMSDHYSFAIDEIQGEKNNLCFRSLI